MGKSHRPTSTKHVKHRGPVGHPNPDALRSDLLEAIALTNDAAKLAARRAPDPLRYGEIATPRLRLLHRLAAAGLEAEIAKSGSAVEAHTRYERWMARQLAPQAAAAPVKPDAPPPEGKP